jgi:fumarate hydratase class I
MADFKFQDSFIHGEDKTPYRKLSGEHVSTAEFEGQTLLKVEPEALTLLARKLSGEHVSTAEFEGQTLLKVEPEALTLLAAQAYRDVSHLFRPGHLAQLRRILDDPEASDNDRFVALEMLRNAQISAEMVLPSCQDTGTAVVIGKKGERVFTGCNDGEALSRGIHQTYNQTNLRYSQVAPLTMYEEKNTGSNLPAQLEIYATEGDEYHFLFLAKGGGSGNKTLLFQQTPALLNPESLLSFLDEKIRSLGTAACPPYHLAIVVGGTSAEATLKTVKLASARYLDDLPTSGNELGRAFRDTGLEEQVHKLTQQTGLGAQFGGKYFCHDVRVIRLPRHGASCPVGIGVSCSADRQILGKITRDGIFLEQLETNPAKYIPEAAGEGLGGELVQIDLNRPMSEIRAELSRHPVKTRLSLTGSIIVARDMAHARLKERIERGEGLPQYFKDHVIYYAGPAKTPAGYASGSFGPTTAGRMDSYVDLFMQHGGSYVTLAKGNRSQQVTDACKKHGGFYLGSIGGPAAILAKNCITSVAVEEYEELGMEAIWRIEVEDFPAFIIVDDKGNDFFADI